MVMGEAGVTKKETVTPAADMPARLSWGLRIVFQQSVIAGGCQAGRMRVACRAFSARCAAGVEKAAAFDTEPPVVFRIGINGVGQETVVFVGILLHVPDRQAFARDIGIIVRHPGTGAGAHRG